MGRTNNIAIIECVSEIINLTSELQRLIMRGSHGMTNENVQGRFVMSSQNERTTMNMVMNKMGKYDQDFLMWEKSFRKDR